MSFICNEWSKPNHYLFQLANIFIVFSNIDLKNRYNLLCIRFCLLLSSLCFSLWGWLVLCSLDTFVWNFLFTCINIFHVSYILYTFYPFIPKLDANAERIYQKFELKDKISRKTFYDIIYKNVWKTETLEKGDIYSVEDLTEANKLSLLLSGRICVIRNKVYLNELSDLSFIDSAQWFVSSKVSPVYKVTLLVLEKSQIICWNSIQLRKELASEPTLEAIINRFIGEDVIKTFYFK